MTIGTALFICALLRKEGERYNYARKWTTGRMLESTIRLPTLKGAPDFGSMEKIILGTHLGWTLS